MASASGSEMLEISQYYPYTRCRSEILRIADHKSVPCYQTVFSLGTGNRKAISVLTRARLTARVTEWDSAGAVQIPASLHSNV